MTLSIKSPEADHLARKLAKMTGGTISQIVLESLQDRLRREEARRATDVEALVEEGLAIVRHAASLPVRDHRSADEIIGYDEHGVPV